MVKLNILFSNILLLSSVIYLEAIRRFRCDYTYYKEADGYLKYHEIPANWHEARLRCQLEGTILASPVNSGLKSAIKNLTQANEVNCGIFTGIHARFSRGDFMSVEGIPLTNIPHKWVKGEPDNERDAEQCLVLTPEDTMADVKCSDTFSYICYAKKFPGMMLNPCGTTDNAYNLDKRTGSCYKFHSYPRTWERAFMTCMAEGGHLAVVNSEIEAQVIKELYAKNPNINLVGDYTKDVAFVGFHDWEEHGEWFTIHGQSLAASGYAKFAPNEPNNMTGQYCGGIYRNGLYDDMWCWKRAMFICEKNPDSLLCDHE